mmetsp:Transcript_35742/g.91907  ORF Transcript_35742/g.91907 Transcript_35742/m.91907 type:complete len:258 (+) Transcript_35742:378-1151(+)
MEDVLGNTKSARCRMPPLATRWNEAAFTGGTHGVTPAGSFVCSFRGLLTAAAVGRLSSSEGMMKLPASSASAPLDRQDSHGQPQMLARRSMSCHGPSSRMDDFSPSTVLGIIIPCLEASRTTSSFSWHVMACGNTSGFRPPSSCGSTSGSTISSNFSVGTPEKMFTLAATAGSSILLAADQSIATMGGALMRKIWPACSGKCTSITCAHAFSTFRLFRHCRMRRPARSPTYVILLMGRPCFFEDSLMRPWIIAMSCV